MDPQSLFNKSQKKNSFKDNKEENLFAIGDSLLDKALAFTLKKEKNLRIKVGKQDEIFNWISQGSVNYGLISSADFALLKGNWKIIPDVYLANSGSSKCNLLFFNKDLSEFKNIAIISDNKTATLVLKILLKELYQLDPNYVIEKGSIEKLLEKYDAVLVSGLDAFLASQNNDSFLDISEEWYYLTGLPLINSFWIANELISKKEDIIAIVNSSKNALENANNLFREIGIKNIKSASEYLTKSVSFGFNDDALASLEEMYRYAFFHSITEFVPELGFVEI